MPKQDAVLCVGAGPLQLALIREAQALGLWVMATDGNPLAPGLALAEQAHVLDTYDLHGHRALAETLATRRDPVLRGVVTAGADVAATVATAAQAAVVPGIAPQIARRLQDKAMVRAILDEAGLERYQPRFALETRQDGLRYALADIAEILRGYPVVVKPLTQRASRGVTMIHEEPRLAAAVDLALTYGDEYLIEQCLTGTEHSIEGIFGHSGEVLWFNVVDRLFSYADGRAIETGHVNPTHLPGFQGGALKAMWLETAQALGVTWGALKIDAILTADGPKILEVCARLSGGYDCQGTSPLTGRHPLRTLLQVSCGLPVELPPPARGYAACAAILPQATGTLRALPHYGESSSSDVPVQVIWSVTAGDAIQPLLHNAQRAGFCLAAADTYDEAWRRASRAAEALTTAMEMA